MTRPAPIELADASEAVLALRPYIGVYDLGGAHRLGIDRFIADNGDSTLLFCDSGD